MTTTDIAVRRAAAVAVPAKTVRPVIQPYSRRRYGAARVTGWVLFALAVIAFAGFALSAIPLS